MYYELAHLSTTEGRLQIRLRCVKPDLWAQPYHSDVRDTKVDLYLYIFITMMSEISFDIIFGDVYPSKECVYRCEIMAITAARRHHIIYVKH